MKNITNFLMSAGLLVSSGAFAKMVPVPKDRIQDYVSAVRASDKVGDCTAFSNLVFQHPFGDLELQISDDSTQPLLVFTYNRDGIVSMQFEVATSTDFKKVIRMTESVVYNRVKSENRGDLKDPKIVKVEYKEVEVVFSCK